MAKSASETRVEDVLSSVRRLVSEELPRNERPAVPEGPGALVLTDAQRIESNAAVRIAGRTLEERIAELEAAVGENASEDDFEPDGSEDQALHRPDRIVYTRPPLPEEQDQMRRNTLRLSQIALIDTGPANEDASDDSETPLHFRHDGAEPVYSDHAEVEEAPMAEDVKETLTAAEVHIFSSPDDEVDRIEARLNGEPVPEPAPYQAAEPIIEDVSDDVADDERASETLVTNEDKPEDAEDIVNQMVDALKAEPKSEEPQAEETQAEETQTDPQDVVELPSEASDAAFEADLEEAVAASVETALVETPETSETPDASPQGVEAAIAQEAIEDTVADILDEDEVRPLVARLIREELRGELGEQITRNVRRLVRREILRALAARDTE